MASSLRVNAIVPASGTNVAIGTAGGTVTYAASVSGISTFSSGIVVAAGSTSAPSISPSGDSNTGIFFPSADTVCIGEGGTEVIRVNSTGNVGVGTTNPSTTLHVNGGLFRVDSGGYGGIILGDNSSNSFHITKETSDNSFGIWSGTIGSGTNRLKIDSGGRLITPNRPAFFAYPNTNTSLGGVQTYVFSLTQFNIGSHYSTATGRFTAPVAGVYHFDYGVQHSGGVNDNLAVDLNVNNSQYSSVVRTEVFTSSTFHIVTASVTIYLNASDFVTIASIAGTAWGDNCWFSGHHVG